MSIGIVGYTYEADCHCVECTRARLDRGGFTILTDFPEAAYTDTQGVPYGAVDNRGNPLHPFDGLAELQQDDSGRPMPCVCGTCGGTIIEA